MSNYKELSTDELYRLASKGDRDAYYWLGDDYKKHGDFHNAAVWLEKAVENLPSNHECFKTAALNLAFLHKDKLISQADDNEAIRLFELVPNLGPTSILLLGLLYYNVQGHNHNPKKGIDLVENAVKQFINEDGNDEYLEYALCYEIARIYFKEASKTNNAEYAWKALDYFRKTVARGQSSKQAEVAKKIIDDYERALGL